MNPVFLIVTRLFITHGKDIYLQSLHNSSRSRLALRFENPIFTNFCTTTFVHCCRVAGNALIQRTRSFVTNLLGEKCNNKKTELSCMYLPTQTRQVIVPCYCLYNICFGSSASIVIVFTIVSSQQNITLIN